MYFLLYNRSYLLNFNKVLKLKLVLGQIKGTPKLNLTLAPLNINLNNLLIEMNKQSFSFLDVGYLSNFYLILNTKNFVTTLIFKNLDFFFIIKNFFNNRKTIDIYIFLTFLYFFFLNRFNKFIEFNCIASLSNKFNFFFFVNYNNDNLSTFICNKDNIFLCKKKFFTIFKSLINF